MGSDVLRDLQGLTVIVVDDDPNVAAVIALFLEAQGVEVAVCEDPRDAVADDPCGWSALITDYDMPIMSGGALVEAINAKAPYLPTFVVTALAQRLSDPRRTQGQSMGIFSKPVDLEAFSHALAVSHGRPVALMSGTANKTIAQEAIDNGAIGLCPKPWLRNR